MSTLLRLSLTGSVSAAAFLIGAALTADFPHVAATASGDVLALRRNLYTWRVDVPRKSEALETRLHQDQAAAAAMDRLIAEVLQGRLSLSAAVGRFRACGRLAPEQWAVALSLEEGTSEDERVARMLIHMVRVTTAQQRGIYETAAVLARLDRELSEYLSTGECH
jgi:hypothetical protein